MPPTVTISTGGVIAVNADQVMRDTGNVFLTFLKTGNNLRNLIIILGVVIVFGLIRLWIRRMEDKRRHKDRENREREKAKIWKEEYKS